MLIPTIAATGTQESIGQDNMAKNALFAERNALSAIDIGSLEGQRWPAIVQHLQRPCRMERAQACGSKLDELSGRELFYLPGRLDDLHKAATLTQVIDAHK